jgi:hypothetical protein
VRDQALSEHNERLIAQWESTIGWGTDETDQVAADIDGAVAAMEETCQPAIDGFYKAQSAGLGRRRTSFPRGEDVGR